MGNGYSNSVQANEKSNKTILQKGILKTKYIIFCFKQHISAWMFLLVLTIAKALWWHLEILFQVIIPVYKVVDTSKNRKIKV